MPGPDWIDHWPDPRRKRVRLLPRWVRRVLLVLGAVVGVAAWVVVCLSVSGILLYVILENVGR
jgi:hypothetical protein